MDYSLFVVMPLNIDVAIDSKRLKINAHQKPSIVNPGTSLLARMIIKALITNRNNPNVTMVIGRVRSTRSGFSKAFKMANTNAKTKAVVKLLMCTPGRT
jgi:hypothetical protein